MHHVKVAIATAIMLLALGSGIAFADQGESSPSGLSEPTAQDLSETVSSSSSVQLTNPAAAEGTPHQGLDRLEAIELTQGVFESMLQSPAGPFDELHIEKFLSDNVAVIGGGDQPEESGVVIGGEVGEVEEADSPPDEESAEAESPEGEATEEFKQESGDSHDVEEPGNAPGEGSPESSGPAQEATEPATLLESTIPLRTEGPSGKQEAVDLSLEQGEDRIHPANPLVEVGIPVELGKGIDLPGSNVQIELEGAPENRAPSTIENSVAFFPNVAQDTDLSVAPTPSGVETLTTLRSADAPRTEHFKLQLPPGATLQANEAGGAEVVKDEEAILSIQFPTALDAIGEGVPVSLQVRGHSLALTVEPTESTAWPVLVDPVYDSYSWWGNGSNAGKSDWHNFANSGPLTPMTTDPWGGSVNALFIWAPEGNYTGNATAEWYYVVPRFAEEEATQGHPPTSFIASMSLQDAGYATSEGPPYPAYGVGIWDAAYKHFAGQPGHEASWGHLGNDFPFHYSFRFENGSPASRDIFAKEGLGLSLWSASSSSYYLENLREGVLGGATIEVGDEDMPTVTAKTFSSLGWFNNSGGAPIKAAITDTGLGVKSIVMEPEMVSAPQWKETLGCSGAAASPCPREHEFSLSGYNPAVMPTGIDYVKIFGEDVVGNKTPEKNAEGKNLIARAEVKVDHIAPEVSLSGSMVEQAIYGTRRSSYTLNVNAVDGTSGHSQSGIASGELKFDGQKVKFEGKQLTEWTPGCKTENCPLSTQWTINAANVSPGSHTVEVTATDAVGNTAPTKKLTVEIHPGSPPTLSLAGSMTEQAGLGTSRPRYLLQANASALSGSDGSSSYEIAYSSAFGTPGTAAGQFTHPTDVAIDAQGNLWVVDKLNSRIEEFTEGGGSPKVFGSAGSTGGKLNWPSGIAIDPGGNVWVTDTSNTRVVEFGKAGEFLATFGTNVNKTKVEAAGTQAEKNLCTAASKNVCQAGTAGSLEGQMKVPMGIAASSGGNLYVVEKGNGRVEKFSPTGEILANFGGPGSGSGQFIEPTSVAVAPDASLWVTDAGNNRIQHWSSTFSLIAAFGKEGTANGEFKHPDAVEIDPLGNVFVADQGNNRVQEFSENGVFLTRFGSSGAGPGQLSLTDHSGIAANGKGEIWVTDTGDNRVEKWIAPKVPAYSSAFGTPGTAAGQFTHPTDVAIDAQGNLWVVDKLNSRIEEFTEGGGSPKVFGSAGSTGGKLNWPSGIAIDPGGNVWVTDTSNTRVVEFGKAGEFLATFGTNVNKTKVEAAGTQAEKNLCTAASKNVCQAGTAGSLEGQMKVPMGIAASSGGNLYVVEKGNGRVEKFSPTGEILANFGGPGSGSGQFIEPTSVAVAPDASLWVTDAGNNRIQHWSSTFSLIAAFGKEGTANGEFKHPDAVEIDPLGNVFVADQGNNRVQEFSENGVFLTRFGSSGAGPGQLSLTDHSGIAANGKGEIWVTDTGDNRVEKWTQQILRSQISSKITVDGKQVSTGQAVCTGESCPLASEWILESSKYAVGKHTIEVEATDGLGRSIVKAVTIEVQRDTTKPTLSSNGPLVNAPAGWVEQEVYALTASAKDGGYGATSLLFKIDGATVATSEKPCPDGGCELSLSKSVSMATYAGGAHSAELVATDGAGNQTFQKWTINVNPDGKISTEEATDTLEAMDTTSGATVVTPPSGDPEVIEAEGQPGLKASGGETIVSTGTDVETMLTTDSEDGVTINAPEGVVHFEPTESEPNAGSVQIAEGVAAVTANSGEEVDSAVRPVYDGATDFAMIRSPEGPETFSWTVELGSGWKLVSESEHMVEVYYVSGVAAMAIADMGAHDATGRTVPTALSVSKGNIVTLTVKHRTPPVGEPTYIYPIVAGAGYETGYSTVEVIQPPPEEGQEPTSEGYWSQQLPDGSWLVAEGGESIVGAPEYEQASQGGAQTSGVWVPPITVSRPFKSTGCYKIFLAPSVPPHPNPAAGQCQVTANLMARGWVHGHFHYEISPHKRVWWNGGREGEIGCTPDYVHSAEWAIWPKECHFAGENFQEGGGNTHIVARHFWRIENANGLLNGFNYKVVCIPYYDDLYSSGKVSESKLWAHGSAVRFVSSGEACPWPE